MKLKPWLRFIEGDEGGSATDTVDTVENHNEDQDGTESEDEVTWESLFEGEDPKDVRKQLDHAREWERRAKANKAAADELAALKAKESDGGDEGPSDAEVKATRYQVALDHGLSREDADLFLTATNEDKMTAQAERLAALTAPKKVKRTTSETNRDRTPPAPTLKSGAELYGRVKAKNLY